MFVTGFSRKNPQHVVSYSITNDFVTQWHSRKLVSKFLWFSHTDDHFYHLSIFIYLLTHEVSVTRKYVFISSVCKLEALCLRPGSSLVTVKVSFPSPHHAIILRGRGIVLFILNLSIKWK